MEELEVTRLWMGGVVGMMMIFAAIALYGYLIRQRREKCELEENDGQK